MTESCINPAEIQEGDLMAYVDGVANEAVAQHIRRCPACAHQVQALTALQSTVTAKLYRQSCPPAERLISYRHDELRGADRLLVAQHVRQCPNCARELARLTRAERGGVPGWLQAAVQVLEGILVWPTRTNYGGVQPAELRAGPQSSSPVPLVYRADDIEVIVSQSGAQALPEIATLAGVVHSNGQVPENAGTATAELYRGAGLIAWSPVSARGQFAFPDIEYATYDICLVWGDREIWLREVRVG